MKSNEYWVFALLLISVVPLSVQDCGASDCTDTITEADGYTVRNTSISARYLRLTPGTVPAKGSSYSPVVVSQLTGAVNHAIEVDNINASVQITGRVPVVRLRSVTSCVKLVRSSDCVKHVNRPLCVDIEIRSIGLNLDPGNLASNLLAVSRSPNNTFFNGVPVGLKLLQPTLGFSSDKTLGFTGLLGTQTNLLDANTIIKNRTPVIRPDRLDLTTYAQYSSNSAYYRSAARLAYLHDAKGLGRQFGINAGFSSGKQPLGIQDNTWNGVDVTGSFRLKPNNPFVSNFCLDLGYRWANNRESGEPQNGRRSVQNSGTAQMLLDLRWLQNFTRLSVWFDADLPERPFSTYHRIASTVGWQRDFGRGTQSIGFEALVGGGQAWGAIPNYSRFFGGNSGSDFIYANPASPAMLGFPTGPTLRSYGHNQLASLSASKASVGGTSYWYFNLSLAIPIPPLSRPLIPRDRICFDTPDGDEKCLAISEIIKDQVNKSGKSFLTTLYKGKGLSNTEAQRRAGSDLKGISNIVGYIVDRANLYAIKPLIMTDCGNVYGPDVSASPVRFSLGGGLQFVLVTAKFEAGYLRSVPTLAGQSTGNFVMRLTFQNLF
jgi:hypothetical protein